MRPPGAPCYIELESAANERIQGRAGELDGRARVFYE
jgi:hypothetical protein